MNPYSLRLKASLLIIKLSLCFTLYSDKTELHNQWQGELSHFKISYHGDTIVLNAPREAGSASLFKRSNKIEDSEWIINLSMEFRPSSANYTTIWLACDTNSYSNISEALYIKAGGTERGLSLWERRNGVDNKLAKGKSGTLDSTTVTVKIKATRTLKGKTNLFIKEQEEWVQDGEAIFKGFNCEWFGVTCNYTATRSDKFSFTDISISGKAFKDTIPNEYYYPERNSVIISEVMFNPSEKTALPNSQFIELYNRGNHPVELNGFSISNHRQTVLLKSKLIYPHQYLLLADKRDKELWKAYAISPIYLSPWLSLLLTEGEIVLKDSKGRVINSLNYHRGIDHIDYKRSGGWSIEIIDPDNLSGDDSNWRYSKAEEGGTPGDQNSTFAHNPDNLFFYITDYHLNSDSCLTIRFSKPIDTLSVNKSSFTITSLENIEIEKIVFEEKFLKSITLCFSASLKKDKKYSLSFNKRPVDIGGTSLDTVEELLFALPVIPKKNSVVINELLFDPVEESARFIELYNRSNKPIDLSSMTITRDNQNGDPERLIEICKERKVLMPASLVVLTEDKEKLINYYKIDRKYHIVEVPQFPHLRINGGTLFLTLSNGKVVDKLNYSPAMHFPLLPATKGVSLERICSEEPSSNCGNWHSASANQNYATPGEPNSQSRPKLKHASSKIISTKPDLFIPEDDHNNKLYINYNFPSQGNSVTIKIYSRTGVEVRELVNNRLTGQTGFFTWDGTDNKGNRLPVGIYIIHVSSFTTNGNVKEFKETTVLGTPL
ncbi:lamin tail domain-containing protein [Marinilabiliaceae bacterium ANBcel2]|nr:lamin tail domain-containing protein [Marinilabiliaceae bacterium ANBcel2]